jgi:glycosyltransferase involved in cell wall biosynthesis
MSDNPDRLRVLYVARAPFLSGAERALLSTLRHLDRTRIAPLLVLGYESAVGDAARDLNVPVLVCALPKRSAGSLLAWRRSLRALRRAVDQFHPDVLHANDLPSCQAMCVVGARRRVPRVVHLRWGVTAHDAAWWARGGAQRLLCISAWVREQLGELRDTPLAGAQVELLPDAVDWPADPACAVPTPVASDATIRVGFAGQLIETKGLDLLLEALALLPAADRPTLLIAGQDTQRGGAYERELRDLAERRGVAGSVQWLGFLDDVNDLYQQVTAMACPSRQEPLGLVPLEAARFGVPTLACRVGGFLETIEDGATGWLVEPSAPAWAAALAQLVATDPATRARIGLAAYARTKAQHAPRVYQERLLAIYEELARG